MKKPENIESAVVVEPVTPTAAVVMMMKAIDSTSWCRSPLSQSFQQRELSNQAHPQPPHWHSAVPLQQPAAERRRIEAEAVSDVEGQVYHHQAWIPQCL